MTTDPSAKTQQRKPRWFRTFAFRLNLWYTLIFSASAAALFLVVYGLLSVAIDRNDREVVQARAAEFAAIYNTRGFEGLRRYLTPLEKSPGQERFFIQVVTRVGNFPLIVPPEWISVGERELAPGIRQEIPYLRIPSSAERDLTLAQTTLRDGSRLQVGRIAASRE